MKARRAIGWCLLGTVVAVVACGPGETAREEKPVEEQAVSRAVETAVPAILREIFAADVPLEGCWRWNWIPNYDNIWLSVRRTGSETFELAFFEFTDYGSYPERDTAATWSGNALVLAVPYDALQEPTRMLFPVRFDGEECLVADAALAFLEPGMTLLGGPEREFAFRRDEKDTLPCWWRRPRETGHGDEK